MVHQAPDAGSDVTEPFPSVEVVIEIPRWSFLKRGSSGRIDFVSPLPCPFNYGAVGMTDRGMYDDKLICSTEPVGEAQRRRVLAFFAFYARCKQLLNRLRGQAGRGGCEGWGAPGEAIGRARRRDEIAWTGPTIPF